MERQSKTELLNIREQLRTEKKRVTKEITDVEEKVTIIEQDQPSDLNYRTRTYTRLGQTIVFIPLQRII